jgi:toxin ParE1/3/4
MGSYVLSNEADLDLQGIAERSIIQWGIDRATQYIFELHKAFETLAEFPHLGRDAGHIRPGYFRFEHDHHTVFYQKNSDNIFVVRVLHEKQLPEKHL